MAERIVILTNRGGYSRPSKLSVYGAFLLAAGALLLSGACGGGGSASAPPPPPVIGNVIVRENAKAGDPSWTITDPSPTDTPAIQGFASATSVNRGESISFYASTSEPSYTMDIFRMGWYGGAGARRMMPTITRTGVQQPLPSPDPDTGLIECQWTDPYTLTIPADATDPTDWASGFYLVKLTAGTSGKQSFIVFVVRDDARGSDLLIQSTVTTYQAYNLWGGKSLYASTIGGAAAVKVSFNRPYISGYALGDGLLERFEYNMVRFLEREGYDVTYSTDVDTHTHGERLLSHKVLLVVGHDEYWSRPMRDAVEAARGAGINLGFFCANTCYWQIRFEPSPVTGAANRTMVCYRIAKKDPYYDDGVPGHQGLVTVQFRELPVNRPEDALLGVMYDTTHGITEGDMVVSDASSWVFAGTGLQNGDHLPGLLGDEVDRVFGDAPPGTTVIAHSPYPDPAGTGQTKYADMTWYTATAHSTVVATGTMQWNWGLDDYAPLLSTGPAHPPLANPAVQQATRNILQRFGATPGSPP
jgi:hypothetical protein